MPLNGHVSLVYGISVDSQSIRKSTYSTGEEGVEKEILSQFLLPSITLCYHIRRCLKQYIGLWLSLVERCVRDAEAAGSNPVNRPEIAGQPFAADLFLFPCGSIGT